MAEANGLTMQTSGFETQNYKSLKRSILKTKKPERVSGFFVSKSTG